VSAGLLREQDMLRDFAKEHGSCFTTAREKCVEFRVERDMCCNCGRGLSGLFFVRSTSFFRTHFIARVRITAARGSLHVSHLILGR
jgi:hypothetical protein